MHIGRVRQWIKMLESGEFTQAKHTLRESLLETEFSHCCLGVACELYAIKVGGFWETSSSFVADFKNQRLSWNEFQILPDSSSGDLPIAVSKWFDISRAGQNVLAGFNDADEPFTKIAAYLRRRVKQQIRTGRVTWPDDISK